MITAVVAPGRIEPGAMVALPEDEAHHLRVRREAGAEPVRLVDGQGRVGIGPLVWQGRAASVRVERAEEVAPPPPLVLAAGAGDRERFLSLVEKATELGATLVIPLATERAGSVATGVRASHQARLGRRALEALKQCGGVWAPEVAPPEDLAQFLARPLPPNRWLADAGGGVAGTHTAGPLVIAVGPEGGFTGAEQERLRAAGFVAVRLGPHTLRFDTAATTALAAAWLARHRESDGS